MCRFSKGAVSVALVSLASTVSLAQDDPARFANTVVAQCGQIGLPQSQTAGEGAQNGQSIRFRAAEYEVACTDGRVGTLDIQLATREPSVVITYRAQDGTADGQFEGSDGADLVRRAIAATCSCPQP